MPGDPEVLQPNSVALTTKELLLEVYHDMKFVRPAVEGLLAVGVAARLDNLERERDALIAAGIEPTLVQRVAKIEKHISDEAVAGFERNRWWQVSGKVLAGVFVFAQFFTGLIFVVIDHLS